MKRESMITSRRMRVIKAQLWKLESLTIKTVVVILLQSMHHQEVYIGWRIQHKEKSVDGKLHSSYTKREKHSTNSNWTIISLSLWFMTKSQTNFHQQLKSSVMFSSDFDHVTGYWHDLYWLYNHQRNLLSVQQQPGCLQSRVLCS